MSTKVVDDNVDQAESDKATSALAESLESARLLVERTRSLLNGEIGYDEGEMAMIAAEPATPPLPESDPETPAA